MADKQKEEGKTKLYIVRKGYVIKGRKKGVFYHGGQKIEMTPEQAEAHKAQIEVYDKKLHDGRDYRTPQEKMMQEMQDRQMKKSPVIR